MKYVVVILCGLITLGLWNNYELHKEIAVLKNTKNAVIYLDGIDKIDTLLITKIKLQKQIIYVQDSILFYSNNYDSLYKLFTAYTSDTSYWNRYYLHSIK